MDVCCLLYCSSTVSRSSNPCARYRIRQLCPGISQRKLNRKMINYGVLFTLFFLTPLVSNIISYIKVAKTIRRHNGDVSSTIRRRVENSFISAREIKLSKSLFVVVFSFMICWTSFWVIVVLRSFRIVANVDILCMFFFYFSNTINPFIYAGMNPVFRREFRKLFFCEQRSNVVVLAGGGKDRKYTQNIVPSGCHERRQKELRK